MMIILLKSVNKLPYMLFLSTKTRLWKLLKKNYHSRSHLLYLTVVTYEFQNIFDNFRDDDGNDLITLQSALDATPFCDLIVQSILAYKIPVETKCILWHQRLGHPCNEYLYSAHKFIDGVLKFKGRSDVISKYSTCIKAKMPKTAPCPNSTKRAIHHSQGLSIDFSFSGIKSKNTG